MQVAQHAMTKQCLLCVNGVRRGQLPIWHLSHQHHDLKRGREAIYVLPSRGDWMAYVGRCP
jgi:hypothetical protein